ncbi:MAG: hypothetical protein COA47_03560 [Robiginitomaculum sp.]|nr:MAG: hypothetical protein COA47_03560 [Robiginitomaculum sp.]
MKTFLFTLIVFLLPSGYAIADGVLVDFGALQPLEIVSAEQTIRLAVEFADDPIERAQGLMHREKMADDHGMLFDFDRRSTVNMWMKNTLIPLDMIFLSKTGRVVTIARNAKPGSLRRISSGVPVSGVLEVNAGMARKWNIRRGDMVQHAMFGQMLVSVVETIDPPEVQEQQVAAAPQKSE